jgi:hypothetical protein
LTSKLLSVTRKDSSFININRHGLASTTTAMDTRNSASSPSTAEFFAPSSMSIFLVFSYFLLNFLIASDQVFAFSLCSMDCDFTASAASRRS